MEIGCSQCGATLTVPADARLVSCSFCDTAMVIDTAGILFHQVMRPTVHPAEVPAHLRRFLAGGETAAGLDRQASLSEPRLEYFPFWAFTLGIGAAERIVLMPAAPSSLQGLQGISLPAGETTGMSPDVTGQAPVLPPEVPLATARQWLVNRHGEVQTSRTVLCHLPLYRLSYSWRGKVYQAGVDGVTGKVFPADFPAKAEAPYLLVAALALVVFGIEGLIVRNLVLKLALYTVSAVPIMGVAWFTSKKV